MYTADQICRMIDSLVGNIFVKFGECLQYFVRLLESLLEQIVLHCWLTYFFTPIKVTV